jgi:Ran GTPase-activating protein (RanGAP) involved in mRNA processing and transport
MLCLSSNGLGVESARHLANALRGSRTLTALNLGDNNLGDEGARAVMEACVEGSDRLNSLSLSNNGITDEGAHMIADVLRLKPNGPLNALNLGDNDMYDLGACAIAFGLKANRSLTELHLHGNGIGPAGAEALGEALKANDVLSRLHLEFNNFGDDGASYLAVALRVNNALTVLSLAENRVATLGTRSFVETLQFSNLTLCLLRGVDDVAVGLLLERNRRVVRCRKLRCQQITVLVIGVRWFNRAACMGSNGKDVISLISRLIWHSRMSTVWGAAGDVAGE